MADLTAHECLCKKYHHHSGKVRDIYELSGGKLLIRATDRTSVYDFRLGTEFPRSGEYLTALCHFWQRAVLQDVPTHCVAWGPDIDTFLRPTLRSWRELQATCVVVEHKRRVNIEAVTRGVLTGSAVKPYREKGEVYGNQLPIGLKDGDLLKPPIFTPTTKAEAGHDLPIDVHEVRKSHPWMEPLALEIHRRMRDYAWERGLLFADTKFEFAGDQSLIDEWGTFHSSRFFDRAAWETGQREGHLPAPLDKQIVRNHMALVETPWGKGLNNNLDSRNAEHQRFVRGLVVPAAVVDETMRAVDRLFLRLTGCTLGRYQETHMHIPT